MFLQSKGLLVTLLSLAVDSALAATSASSYLNNTISLSYGGGLGLGPGYLNLTALQQIYSSSGGSIA